MLAAEEVAGAAQDSAQGALCPCAVQTDVPCPRRTGVSAAACGQPSSVQSIAVGDQYAELMTADGVCPCEVDHARVLGVSPFKNGPGEIRDMNQAPDVTGEEHTAASPSGQVVGKDLVHGATATDNQRGASEDGVRGDPANRRFGSGLRGPYGVMGSGRADSL